MSKMVQVPDKVHLDESSYTNTFGRFTIQPLEKGYGVTIGNALRRVLLSSLPGAAFTSLHIRGMLHEFSPIPGVVEDVAEIVLNLKGVRMKLINQRVNRISLVVKGPKAFTAADLQKACPQIEILNPSHHIAMLNAGAEMEIELTIGRGKGYVPADDNKMSDMPVGTIPLDSIYTPIKNVRYFVDQVRVGQRIDYEKLVIEVVTDGSITPDDAVAQAASILQDHIKLFVNLTMRGEISDVSNEKEDEFNRIRKFLMTKVDELELSVRSHNCLKTANIKTIADLVRREEPELLKFRNFGRKSLAELEEIIESYGLHFGMDVDKYLKGSSN